MYQVLGCAFVVQSCLSCVKLCAIFVVIEVVLFLKHDFLNVSRIHETSFFCKKTQLQSSLLFGPRVHLLAGRPRKVKKKEGGSARVSAPGPQCVPPKCSHTDCRL